MRCVNYLCLVSFKSFRYKIPAMSNEQELTSPLKSKYTLIKDPKLLEKIKLEEEEEIKNGKEALYIAPNETDETMDQDMLNARTHDLKTSADNVGQLRALEVAVWFDDPNKNSTNSLMRIHRRIINGRHRYRADITWRREYYDFSGFATKDDKINPVLEYNIAKGHFDMQKKATREERTVWVRNMCELGMKLGQEVTSICNWVVKRAKKEGISNKDAITEVCEDKFKDTEMRNRKLGKTFESTGVDTKEVKKLKKVAGEKYQEMEAKKLKFETENHQLQKEIIGLKEDNTKGVNVMEDLQQQIRLVANIDQEEKCQCGIVTKLKVDAGSGKVIISEKK